MKGIVFFLCIAVLTAHAQQNDSITIKNIFNSALLSDTSYENLRYLCKKIGGRLCGSPQAAAAVEWSEQLLKKMNLDTVYKQPCMVENWVRGTEYCSAASLVFGQRELNICSLGGAVGTGDKGIYGNVVEVKNFDELKNMGEAKVKGKFVFFNRAMDPTFYYTFMAYGGAYDQRGHGASEAAKYGAAGAIVRSLTLEKHKYTHTGIMRYEDNINKIPAVAISTLDADMLSQWLIKDPSLSLFLKTKTDKYPDVVSYNVIGEIKGSEYPDEIITVGGHIDSWDNAEGAHDDGAGTVETIDVLRIFKAMNYKPKRTIRCVVFMDEEVQQRGAKKYAEQVNAKNEKIIAAIESDRGGFVPTGFSIAATDAVIKKIQQWEPLLKPYGIYNIIKGYSGVDIGPLEKTGTPCMGLMPDSQRYFDVQHGSNDNFETVNKRELQLGGAAIASLIYLIDTYGLTP